MPNKKYKVVINNEEKIFSVGDTKYDEFINIYPSAIPAEDFQNDPANAETNVGSNQNNTVSSLENGSSDLPEEASDDYLVFGGYTRKNVPVINPNARGNLDFQKNNNTNLVEDVFVDGYEENIRTEVLPKIKNLNYTLRGVRGLYEYANGVNAKPTGIKDNWTDDELVALYIKDYSSRAGGAPYILKGGDFLNLSAGVPSEEALEEFPEIAEVKPYTTPTVNITQLRLEDQVELRNLNNVVNDDGSINEEAVQNKTDFLMQPLVSVDTETGDLDFKGSSAALGVASNIFREDEDEGLKVLERLYEGTNINFKQTNFFDINTKADATGVAGTNVINVSIPGVEEELLLEFNTDPAGLTGYSIEKQAEVNLNNLKKLEDYFKKYSDKIEIQKEYKEKREDTFYQYRRIKEQVFNSPKHALEVKNIEERFNRKKLEEAQSEARKLFDGTAKSVIDPTSPVYPNFNTSVLDLNTYKLEFEDGELTQRKRDFIKQLKNTYSEEQLEVLIKGQGVDTIERYAELVLLTQYKEKKISDLEIKNLDNAIDKLSSGLTTSDLAIKVKSILTAGSRFEQMDIEEEQVESIKLTNIVSEKQQEVNSLAAIMEEYATVGNLPKDKMDILKNAMNKYGIFFNYMENSNVEEITTKDENGKEKTVVYDSEVAKNLKKFYNELAVKNLAYNNILVEESELRSDAAEALEDTKIIQQTSTLNYSLAEKYIDNIMLGTSDIAVGITNLGFNIVTLGTQLDEETAFTDYYRSAQRGRASYTRDVEFDDAFSSAGNFGKFLGQEISNQIPIIATMIASGGYGGLVIGVQAAGEKQMAMNDLMLLGDPSVEGYSKDFLHWRTWLKSAGYGLAEGGFAQLTTVPILKRSKKLFSSTKKDLDLLDNSMQTFFKTQTPFVVQAPLLESAGEVATIGAQNLIDGRDFTEGMDHAATSGFGFGLMFSGVPFMAGAYNAKYSSYNAYSNIRKDMTQLTQLEYQYNVIKDKRTKAAKALQSQISNLSSKIDSQIIAQENIIKNNLRAGGGQSIINIRKRQVELQNKANEILSIPDAEMSVETKRKIINSLQTEFNLIESIRKNALSDGSKRKLATEFIALQANDPDAYNEYINRAKTQITGDKTFGSLNDENVNALAYEYFLYDQVKAENKKTNGNAIKLTELETKADALDFVNNLLNEGTIDQEIYNNVVKAINANSDGFAISGTDVTIAIVENQVINQQKYVGTHEIGHQAFWKIFGTDYNFDPISAQLLKSMRKLDKSTYKEFMKDARIYKEDGTVDPREVISVFLEYVAADKFTTKEKASGLAGMFGAITQKGLSDYHNFDFAGEADMYNFAVGLGKKIADGTLTTEDIVSAQQNSLTQAEAVSNAEAPIDIAESSSTNLDGMLNSFVVNAINDNRKSKGLPPIPADYVADPERKRKYIRDFVNKMLTTDRNGNFTDDFMNSKLVTESTAMGPYITTISNKIWNGLDPMNREGYTKDVWKTLVATELSTMIQQEYLRPNKDGITKFQDLDKFVRNRGFYRVFELARETFKQTPANVGVENVMLTETEVDLESRQAELDQIKKDRANRTDFMSRVKIVDSDNKLIPLPERVINKAKDNIVKTFRTKRFKNKVGTNKHRAELAKEYSGPIGLVFKNIMQRGENFDNDVKLTNQQKRANYSQFLSQNYDLVYDLDIDILTKKYPFLVENTGVRMNAEQIRAYNDAIDKGIRTGRKIKDIKSGPFIFEKIDKAKGKIEYLKYFEGDNVAANVRGARQLSLADEFAQQVSFDLQSDVLIDNRLKTEDFVQKLAKSTGRVAFSFVRGLPDTKQKQFIASLPDIAARVNPSSTNWGDAESIEKTFKNVLSGILPNFTKGEISQVANKIAKFANRFDLMDPVLKQKAQSDNTLEQYLIESVTEAGELKNIKSFLNLENDIGFYFNDKVRLEKHRGLVLDYIRNEDGTVDKDRLIDILKYRSMYTGASRISANQFIIVDGNIVERPYNQKFNKKGLDYATGEARQGYQVFENVKDLYNHLNSLTGVNIEGGSVTINGETLPIPSLIPQTSVYALGNPDYEAGLAQAKDARKFVKDMISRVVDGKNYDNADLAMIIKQLDSQMTAPLKSAADLKYVIDGKLDPKKAKYEHMIPTNWVVMNLLNAYKNSRSSADSLADQIFENYNVAVIPNAMDTFLTKIGLQSVMPVGYQLGDPSWTRYYNMLTLGNKNFVAIRDLSNNSIIGQDWEIAANNGVQVDKVYNRIKKYQSERNALNKGSSILFSEVPKGISVWDFDDTLARTKSKVLYTLPDGTTGSIDATEFALNSGRLDALGAVYDFSEFNLVKEGTKGPMFEKAIARNKKFGNKNVFILTARPQAAAPAIHQFLKGIGLDIRIENIVGLEDGTPKAKADWMVTKIAEGYNDFYFADDALKNVKAVKQIYDNFDIKGKVQQAKVAFSKGLSTEFNKMLERQKGVGAEKVFSDVVARRRGKKAEGFLGRLLPHSADDIRGLTQYVFAGKGKQGEADQKFFEDAIMTPYFKGVAALETFRQQSKKDVDGLFIAFPNIKRKLNKTIAKGDFTHDAAIRVYLWTKAGETIPGISKRDQDRLFKFVNTNSELKGFADGLLLVSGRATWPTPETFWDSQTTLSDLNNITKKGNRQEFLAEFIENADEIFSPQNLNKIEALYGKSLRNAIEDSLHAMKTGSNRTAGTNRINNAWLNWINNSVGTIMFFNRRSALLQLISTTNFINWSDNNMLKAGLAFANQKQYWKDWTMIWNSDKLKQRRGGLQSDVQEAEIAAAAKNAKDIGGAIISKLLKLGFTPTKLADSFAIATGGASFYRNRVNTYLKQGLSKAEAEAKAFEDFSKVSDEAQQSGDPALVSQQQRSTAGRLILAFQNTPMQYFRLMKKASQDLINGRGDAGTNISKIIYYGAIQNLIFNTLQNAFFALIPGFDDEEIPEFKNEKERKKYYEKIELKESQKHTRILNGMVDSVLRGMGIYGAIGSTIKNTIMKYNEQEQKGFTADHTYTIIEAANISPPVGSKLRKIYSGIQTRKFDKDVIEEHPWDVKIGGKFNPSPNYDIIGSLSSALLNLPLDRALIEIKGITEMLDKRNTQYQRIALALGWRTWDVNTKNEEFDLIKDAAAERRKIEGIEKAKRTRQENKRLEAERVRNMTLEEQIRYYEEIAEKNKQRGIKAANTRRENKRIKDSIASANFNKAFNTQ